MACRCQPRYVVDPPPQPCDDCLQVNSLIIGCDDGPAPCGESFEIDLAEYNDVTACGCSVVYSLVGYDEDGFDSVTITPQGVLTAVTAEINEPGKLWQIQYNVDCPCSILSASANVYACMPNPCPVECHDNCDPCTGICNDIPFDLEIT